MDVPQAARVGAPTWVNTRTVLGLLLFSLAFVAGQRVLAQGDQTVEVWAAARPLGIGQQLAAADLRPVDVRLPSEVMDSYVMSAQELVGARLTRPIEEGELVPAAWVTTTAAASASRTITVPVTPDHGGAMLAPGDRIDIFATFDSTDRLARTFLLARGIEVLDLVHSEALVVEDASAIGVTVAVTPDQAQQIVLAIRSGEIDVARVVGEVGATHGSAPVRVGDFK